MLFPQPFAQGLEAGAAKVVITPEAGAPLNGYPERLGRGAESAHDPLYARAVYLGNGDNGVFLAAADLLYIHPELRRRVLELAPTVVPAEHIVLTATHTHNGAGGMHKDLIPRWFAGPWRPDVLEHVARGMARAMREAYENKERAAIGYGMGEAEDLVRNRRHDPDDEEEAGVEATQLGVLRVDNADGAPLAIISSFAAHPDIAPESALFSFSADFPGVYYTALEEQFETPTVAIFWNGAVGDMAPAFTRREDDWGPVEEMGRRLADAAFEVAEEITCSDLPFSVSTVEAPVPMSIAGPLLPDETIFQRLRVADLVVDFLPGEPTAALGATLRERAAGRGAAAYMPVSCANDYLLYFVPREHYAHPHYEAAMHLLGPGAEDWLTAQLDRLQLASDAVGDISAEEAPSDEVIYPQLREQGVVPYLQLSGSDAARGEARGAAMRQAIEGAWRREVLSQTADAWRPREGFWRLWPAFLDPQPLALPALAGKLRPLLAGAGPSLVSELEGMTEGAAMPFDALWLLQMAPDIPAHGGEDGALFDLPQCLMAAAVDVRGANGLIVGHNFEWPDAEAQPLVVEHAPEVGLRHVTVGFPWHVGAYSGMNQQGLVVCIERLTGLAQAPPQAVNPSIIARDLLLNAGSFELALERLQEYEGLEGYQMLLAGFELDMPRAAIIQFGAEVPVRMPEEGLLLGIPPGAGIGDDAARARYERAARLLPAGLIDAAALETVLQDRDIEAPGRADIWNANTRYSVVFEPEQRRIRVAVPTEDGPSSYASFTLEEAGDG